MKIEKQYSKFIKPFVPTPQTLKHCKLGFIDEISASMNVEVVLFFSTNSNSAEYVALLEKSLEKMLTRFYPLAGRYDEEANIVNCNDQGAKFINATVNIKLQDILVDPHVNFMFLDEFISSKDRASHPYNDSILKIQVTTFECGGVALGVSASHKIVDASTLCTFLNEWAVMNQGENKAQLGSFFNSSSLFPGRGLRSTPSPTMSDDSLSKLTRMKLSFSESVISNLKVQGNSRARPWSKVQTVAAILWNTFIHVDREKHKFPIESVLLQPVNLREKMASLIPRNSCGNLWTLCATKSTTLETTEELTNRLSDSVKKTITDLSKAYNNNEEGQMMVLNSFTHMADLHDESTHLFLLSSWCKFPFYEADFGFGKPIWVVPVSVPTKNSAHLMDTAGGNGVEAYVILEVKDVPYFKEALHHVNDFSA